MNQKLVTPRRARTWHSLWDEMFSASTAFDTEADSDLAWSDSTRPELHAWITERAARQSNDNGSF